MQNKIWKDVCRPYIEFKINNSKGTKIFEELVGNKEDYIYEICELVCKTLYKDASEVPNFEKLTFIIDDFDGIAWKDGEPPHITVAVSNKYLEDYNDNGGNIKEEVKGILLHEITHAYQHSKNMHLSAIEGVADLVRYLNGYIDISYRKTGGNYDSSYKTTAFFFDWVRSNNKEFDFLYELNQRANPKCVGVWSWKYIDDLCNKSIEELWEEYQRDIS